MMNIFPFLMGVAFGAIVTSALVAGWVFKGLDDQGEEQEREQ